MPRIYVNLAFDHELSLGGVTSSYDRNLFAPTREILDLADRIGVPVTLYTDVLGGLRLKEWGDGDFTDPYEQQLREALGRGHDVQLHLHPHWMDVTRDDGRFVPSSRYSLHDFRECEPPNDIEGLVERGVAYLQGIGRDEAPEYRPVAYRAGGLAIENSSDRIVASLLKHGIRIDSSIAPGFTLQSRVNQVDFSETPATINWFIGPDRPLMEAAASKAPGESLFEIPIVTAARNPINNLPALARRVLKRSLAPATGGVTLYDSTDGPLDKLARLFPFSTWTLSFDYYWASGRYLLRMLRRFVDSYGDNGEDIYVSTLSHPKSIGPGGLTVMRDFVAASRDAFGDDIQFVTCPEVVERLDG